MPRNQNTDLQFHEGLTGVDPDLLGGKFGQDVRGARDFANNHPIPNDGVVLEGIELTGGGNVDVIEHGIGREPVAAIVVWTSELLADVPETIRGQDLSDPLPNTSHLGLRSNTAATINLLVFGAQRELGGL